MGKFISANFRAGWKKVGTFTIADSFTWNGNCPTTVKVGGNVAAYFCTPKMQVLGVVPGNVTAGARVVTQGNERLLPGQVVRVLN